MFASTSQAFQGQTEDDLATNGEQKKRNAAQHHERAREWSFPVEKCGYNRKNVGDGASRSDLPGFPPAANMRCGLARPKWFEANVQATVVKISKTTWARRSKAIGS